MPSIKLYCGSKLFFVENYTQNLNIDCAKLVEARIEYFRNKIRIKKYDIQELLTILIFL